MLLTIRAGAAPRKGHDDMIARRQGADCAAHGMHNTGAFVAVNRGIRRSEIAVTTVQIGLAHPARDHADDHLVRAGIAEIHFLQDEGSRTFADNSGSDLHSKLSKLAATLSMSGPSRAHGRTSQRGTLPVGVLSVRFGADSARDQSRVLLTLARAGGYLVYAAPGCAAAAM
jgi:hypothetical protein